MSGNLQRAATTGGMSASDAMKLGAGIAGLIGKIPIGSRKKKEIQDLEEQKTKLLAQRQQIEKDQQAALAAEGEKARQEAEAATQARLKEQPLQLTDLRATEIEEDVTARMADEERQGKEEVLASAQTVVEQLETKAGSPSPVMPAGGVAALSGIEQELLKAARDARSGEVPGAIERFEALILQRDTGGLIEQLIPKLTKTRARMQATPPPALPSDRELRAREEGQAQAQRALDRAQADKEAGVISADTDLGQAIQEKFNELGLSNIGFQSQLAILEGQIPTEEILGSDGRPLTDTERLTIETIKTQYRNGKPAALEAQVATAKQNLRQANINLNAERMRQQQAMGRQQQAMRRVQATAADAAALPRLVKEQEAKLAQLKEAYEKADREDDVVAAAEARRQAAIEQEKKEELELQADELMSKDGKAAAEAAVKKMAPKIQKDFADKYLANQKALDDIAKQISLRSVSLTDLMVLATQADTPAKVKKLVEIVDVSVEPATVGEYFTMGEREEEAKKAKLFLQLLKLGPKKMTPKQQFDMTQKLWERQFKRDQEDRRAKSANFAIEKGKAQIPQIRTSTLYKKAQLDRLEEDKDLDRRIKENREKIQLKQLDKLDKEIEKAQKSGDTGAINRALRQKESLLRRDQTIIKGMVSDLRTKVRKGNEAFDRYQAHMATKPDPNAVDSRGRMQYPGGTANKNFNAAMKEWGRKQAALLAAKDTYYGTNGEKLQTAQDELDRIQRIQAAAKPGERTLKKIKTPRLP